MFEGDLKHSRRITLDEHRQRGWVIRSLEVIFSPIARFL
jgi:hypothetical protein